MAEQIVLMPALYWSPSLARDINGREGDDQLHGLIDATAATFLMTWIDGTGWTVLRDLPGDALRLVAEVDLVAPATVVDRIAAELRILPGLTSSARHAIAQVLDRVAERAP